LRRRAAEELRRGGAIKLKHAITAAYDRLVDAVEKTPGFDGQPVKKIEIDRLRDEVKRRGFLDTKETGGLTGGARNLFMRAKTDLIASGRYIESDGTFWKLAARPFSHAAHGGQG
jgi:hypothetical protein